LVFALLALCVVAPYELIVTAVTGKSPYGAQSSVSSTVTLFLIDYVLVGPLISALHIHAVRTVGSGDAPRLGDVALRGLRVLPTVAAAQIIATIGIVAGFLAFIVPGVILLIRWAVVAQAAAIESENWVEALKRSAELTAGNYLHVIGLLISAGLIAAILTNIGIAIAGTHTTVASIALAIVVETIARSFVAITSAVLYFDLVARRSVAHV
jgi:hypothetical protein